MSRGSSTSSNQASGKGKSICCTICWESYKAADNIYAGSCGHVFHWHCLQNWWKESKRCPICRKTTDEYFKLYLDFEDNQTEAGRQQSSSSTSGATGRTTSSSDNNNNNKHINAVSVMNEYENLLYESGIYRDEIEYLNSRIAGLTLQLSDSE